VRLQALAASLLRRTDFFFFRRTDFFFLRQITMDDSSLTCAPAGFDSVLAKGNTEPGTVCEKDVLRLKASYISSLRPHTLVA
jgi:hypothetical protein